MSSTELSLLQQLLETIRLNEQPGAAFDVASTKEVNNNCPLAIGAGSYDILAETRFHDIIRDSLNIPHDAESNSSKSSWHSDDSSVSPIGSIFQPAMLPSILPLPSELDSTPKQQQQQQQQVYRKKRSEILRLTDLLRLRFIQLQAQNRNELCGFCKTNGEDEFVYRSHSLRDAFNRTTCPILRAYRCPICGKSGDEAHTVKYCPVRNMYLLNPLNNRSVAVGSPTGGNNLNANPFGLKFGI